MRLDAPRTLALLLVLASATSVGLAVSGPASAATPPVGLGTAGAYAVLAGSTVTNTGPSTLVGDLGVSPGSAATGFPPGLVTGTTHLADAVAGQAQLDLTAAYLDASARTPFVAVATELGGRTLVPGVYRGGPLELTGTMVLRGRHQA